MERTSSVLRPTARRAALALALLAAAGGTLAWLAPGGRGPPAPGGGPPPGGRPARGVAAAGGARWRGRRALTGQHPATSARAGAT
ncbi:hypothetical protein AAHZ94_30940, partial [Streptomyces sp. HSW2009]|uniref:hypothetical protein n=1 Tax=Streptomyces sp. HSW2009 TaxID=3142890 RepID=UPI0032EC0F7F